RLPAPAPGKRRDQAAGGQRRSFQFRPGRTGSPRMNLLELARANPQANQAGVPEWMLGHFRRRTISFFDGRSDERTQVHWLQSRTFTIDLRLPDAPPPPVRAWQDYSSEELRVLANHEGWMADSIWRDGQLGWEGGVSLQTHNRWPEPAILHRVGNC